MQAALSQIDWPKILSTIFTLLAAIVAMAARRYLTAHAAAIENADVREILFDLVAAAEQMFPGTGTGEAKLAHVRDQVEQLKLPVNTTDIEAAVYRLNAAKPAA
jgi:hypothetical protein